MTSCKPTSLIISYILHDILQIGSRKIGVPEKDNFVTIDLFEGKNLGQVVLNVLSIKRLKGFGFEKQTSSDPAPKLADVNTRDDSTEKTSNDFFHKAPVAIEAEVKRTGPAYIPGRMDNQKAEICPACSRAVTTGQVTAVTMRLRK